MYHFLIIDSNYHQEINESLLEGATKELEKHNITYQKITAPGALELPVILNMACMSDRFDAIIVLGCVIKGETINFDLVSQECIKNITKIAVEFSAAVGNGVITADNYEQAWARADINQKNKGGEAALGAIRMAEIKDKFLSSEFFDADYPTSVDGEDSKDQDNVVDLFNHNMIEDPSLV